MTSLTTIILLGDNLGQRHRYLNTLVQQAQENTSSSLDIEALPEESPVDRIFKIDLATKLKNVDYILRNFKEDDMLYVSRALKAKWLLDYHDIINPEYLEGVLFPLMIAPAVTKLKHWLYINLRDAAMCQKFYQYYKEITFEFSIKFLSHCNNEFLIDEVPKILSKLSPHALKVLCQKYPQVAKMYYDSLETDENVKKRYLEQEKSYYNSVKCVLKSDTDLFLDITEKYFNLNNFNRLSPLATDYILRHHKTRFTNKLELYAGYLLHISTLADRLSVEECQEVVLKLARASYLQDWFQYKVVEPLIKRIRPDKRAAFKKQIFVEKDVGELVMGWPYSTPAPPVCLDTDPHIFDDENYSPVIKIMKRLIKKKKGARHAYCEIVSCMDDKLVSDLDRLYNEFRFIGFSRALHDLGLRLRATASADRRRDIFLVLVSKTGGRTDAVSALLRLAARHTNEPPHTRASVLRSLVKRANVWRLPDDVWQNLLEFGHGLGLNGATPEADCREGLHAVVIRQLLSGKCEQATQDAFLNDFTTLAEYSLKPAERTLIGGGLQNMLAVAAIGVEPAVAAERLDQLLDVVDKYHIRVEASSPAVEAVKNLALRDANAARYVLRRLYDARIARRELLHLNMAFRRDEAALMNALRHEPKALKLEQVADIIATSRAKFDGLISKLSIYFNQNEDFTVHLRSALKEKFIEKSKKKSKNCTYIKLARPLSTLFYKDYEKELHELDTAGTERVRVAAALRASAHRARPAVNLAELGWRKAGVKAIATQAMRCREIERSALTRVLEVERRTIKVALALSMRSTDGLLLNTFASAAKLRPVVALRVALSYFRHHQATTDPRVWDIVKPLFSIIDLSSRERLCQLLRKLEWIPSAFKPDYCGTLYLAIKSIPNSRSEYVIRDICMSLPEVKEDMIENILLLMFEKNDNNKIELSFPAIFVRYLMLSTDHEDFEKRFNKIGDRFLDRLDGLRCEEECNFKRRLNQFLQSLKYNAAFLDSKYMMCLSVIQRIITWLQKFMPKEEYFDVYVQIHLTMLYFKAVRQSMKQMPDVFTDTKRRRSEGVEAVGFIFGRYIVKEVAELVNTYFDSIIELYTNVLVDYLGDNFMYGNSRAKFIGSVLRGILKEAVGNQRRMAVYVLRNRRHDIEESTRKDLEDVMVQDKCIELFVHAELFD